MHFGEKLLKKLINIPSPSGNKQAILKYLVDYLLKYGFKVKKYKVDKGGFILLQV